MQCSRLSGRYFNVQRQRDKKKVEEKEGNVSERLNLRSTNRDPGLHKSQVGRGAVELRDDREFPDMDLCIVQKREEWGGEWTSAPLCMGGDDAVNKRERVADAKVKVKLWLDV